MPKYRFWVGETTTQVEAEGVTLEKARNNAYEKVPKGTLLFLEGVVDNSESSPSTAQKKLINPQKEYHRER